MADLTPAERPYTDTDVERYAQDYYRITMEVQRGDVPIPWPDLVPEVADEVREETRRLLDVLTAAGWLPPSQRGTRVEADRLIGIIRAQERAQAGEDIARYFDGWAAAAGAVHADAMVESWHEAARLARQVTGAEEADRE